MAGRQPGNVAATDTWNDAAEHRRLSPSERLRLTIEVSRAVLRFATGPRGDDGG